MSDNVYTSAWPGLNSYTEEDQSRFFGRDREIDLLRDVISTESLCTIYGTSGVGKTSLLQAGVFPELRARCFLPVYLRLGHDKIDKPYVVQVIEGCLAAARKSKLEVLETCPALRASAQETLWEWFHRHKFLNAVKKVVRPVLVIDQFEEVFTQGSGKAEKEAWFDELTDLCSNSVPESVADFMSDSENDLAFQAENQTWRTVICLREDFLSRLEDKTVEYPIFKQNRLSIGPLSSENATEAVLKGGNGIVDVPVAESIVRYVGGSAGKIETPLLSLFCSRLDILRQRSGLSKISQELVEGKKGKILNSFYDEAMGRISASSRDYLEANLLNEGGYRTPIQLEEAERNGVRSEEWKTLERVRLLHVISRDNVQWLEFSHDTLAPVAKSARERRKADKERHAMQEKLARSRRRTRRLFYAFVGLIGFIGIAAFALWFLFYKEHVAYYREFTKKWGHPVGIGAPLTMEQVSHRECSFRMIRRGLYSRRGFHFEPTYAYRVEAVNGRLQPTTAHGMGTYLWRGEDTTEQMQKESGKRNPNSNGTSGDSLSKGGMNIIGKDNPNDNHEKSGMNDKKNSVAVRSGFLSSAKLGTVCRWEFMCDKDGLPEREIGYDEKGEIVWMMPYAIETTANGGKPESVIVHFTMKDGYPARLRSDNAEYVRITYDNKNGYETCHEFRDRDGNKTKGPDGAYAQSRENDTSGRLKKQASLGANGEYVIDEAKNTGLRVEYSDDNREIRFTSFGTNEEVKAVNSGWVKCVQRYDEWGNLVEQSFYDVTNRLAHSDGWPSAIIERDSHGLKQSVTSRKPMPDGEDLEQCVLFDVEGNATNVVWRMANDKKPICTPGSAVHMICREYTGKDKCSVEWYLDANNEAVTNENGVARDVRIYDTSTGVLNCMNLYALPGQGGVLGCTNVHHLCRIFDGYGNQIGERHLDAEGNPAADNDGVFESHYWWEGGYKVREDYLAPNGKGGISGDTNVHHTVKIYNVINGANLCVREEYYDYDESPVADNNGIARVVYTYDTAGVERRRDFYSVDAAGGIWGNTNLCHVLITCDERGKTETQQFFDRDGRYVAEQNGAVVGRVRYNQGGNKYYMVDGFSIPTVGFSKDRRTCRVTRFYREDGGERRVEEVDFSGNRHIKESDVNGNVISEEFVSAKDDGIVDFSLHGVAKINRCYGIKPTTMFERLFGGGVKDKNTCVREIYFDSNGRPVVNRFGIAGWCKETDYSTGKIGRTMYFDATSNETKVVQGKIVTPKKVRPLGLADNNGIKVGDIICHYNDYDLLHSDLDVMEQVVATGMCINKRIIIARRNTNGKYDIIPYLLPPGALDSNLVDVPINEEYYKELEHDYAAYLKTEQTYEFRDGIEIPSYMVATNDLFQTLDLSGVHSMRVEIKQDNKSHSVGLVALDADRKQVLIPNGFSEVRTVTNSQGTTIRQDFHALSGEGGVWGCSNINHAVRLFDGKGRITNECYYTVSGLPATNKCGMVRWEAMYTVGDVCVAIYGYDGEANRFKAQMLVEINDIMPTFVVDKSGIKKGDIIYAISFGTNKVDNALISNVSQLKQIVAANKSGEFTIEFARKSGAGFVVDSCTFPAMYLLKVFSYNQYPVFEKDYIKLQARVHEFRKRNSGGEPHRKDTK